MRLIFPDLSTYFEFDNYLINRLIIESPAEWRNVLQSLHDHAEKGIEYVKIFNNIKEISFASNAEIIFSPIDISANQTKIINKLYKELSAESMNEALAAGTYSIKRDLYNYMEQLIFNKDIDLICNDDFDIAGLLKLMGVCFDETASNPLEKLLNYMLNIHALIGDILFILISFSDYLVSEEKTEFYETVLAKGIKVLIIDRYPFERNEFEKIVIVDKDLCEI